MQKAERFAKNRQWKQAAETLWAARTRKGYSKAPEALALLAKVNRFGRKVGLLDAFSRGVIHDAGRAINATVILPDRNLAIFGDAMGWPQAVSLADGGVACKFPKQSVYQAQGVSALCSSGNQRLVLWASKNGGLFTWDLSSQQVRQVCNWDQGNTPCASLAVDGDYAVSGSWDYDLKLWDVIAGNCVKSLNGHTDAINCVGLSPDSRLAFSTANDRTIRIWDLNRGACVVVCRGHEGAVYSAAMPIGSTIIVSAASDKTVRIWDVRTSSCLKILSGHEGEVRCIAVSKDGRWGCSGSDDGAVHLWDLKAATLVRRLEADRSGIRSIAFSDDGRWLLAGSYNGTLRLWELEWEYEFPVVQEWDEGARPYLATFLTNALRGNPRSSESRVQDQQHPIILTRKGRDVSKRTESLFVDLENAGFGWLRPEDVRT